MEIETVPHLGRGLSFKLFMFKFVTEFLKNISKQTLDLKPRSPGNVIIPKNLIFFYL
jgi:hypothetical protein